VVIAHATICAEESVPVRVVWMLPHVRVVAAAMFNMRKRLHIPRPKLIKPATITKNQGTTSANSRAATPRSDFGDKDLIPTPNLPKVRPEPTRPPWAPSCPQHAPM
jgi:hypothetical protein